MTSLQQINKWSKKYPFDEGEIEIILRCHDSVRSQEGGSFLNVLAHSFPYVFFFLPNDEIQNRISLVENHILPKNFGNKFKRTVFPMIDSGDDSEAIELSIAGVAKSYKGDTMDTLGVIFDCCTDDGETAEPEDIITLCYQLSIASKVLVEPRIDEKRIIALAKQPLHLHGLVSSLANMKKSEGSKITKDMFVSWGLNCVPHIGSTMAGFVHHLVFHKRLSNFEHSPFSNPEINDYSSIFTDASAGNLFAISCMSPDLGGKWRRIFSSECKKGTKDTISLEHSISQHVGSTIFVVQVDSGHLIGGVVESGWKFGYFLFEIEPLTRIHHSKGATTKFFIRHNVEQTTPHGETLTGTGFFVDGGTVPELFISDHFHWCKATFLDVPFAAKITGFEVWGVEELGEGQSLKGKHLHSSQLAPNMPFKSDD